MKVLAALAVLAASATVGRESPLALLCTGPFRRLDSSGSTLWDEGAED